ncbi:hypothetical protein HPB47_000051 [Ixodes persulcatus]|uniref:Uncharacterized protein n=1 Tax=Ixodes persulcatus TaxID=34615 RepID=A0AC60PTG0_IXOPE|nr:hypothetical protein HPB47_000051 [Ixodes persulcatus]
MVYSALQLRNPSYDGSTSFCHRLETSVGDNALWQGSQREASPFSRAPNTAPEGRPTTTKSAPGCPRCREGRDAPVDPGADSLPFLPSETRRRRRE